MEITRLEPDDWALYRAIRLESLRVEPEAFGASLAATAAHPEEIWRTRLATAQKSSTNHLFFASEGGRVVGMIGSYFDTRDEKIDVVSFYVSPSERGRGVGRALLTRLVQELAPEELRLVVNEDQAAAVALYREAGFQVTAYHDGFATTGQPRREAVMVRRPGGREIREHPTE